MQTVLAQPLDLERGKQLLQWGPGKKAYQPALCAAHYQTHLSHGLASNTMVWNFVVVVVCVGPLNLLPSKEV